MRIQTRLVLTLSLLALAVVLAIVLVFQWRFDRGMVEYINAQQRGRLESIAAELADRWAEEPGWPSLRDDPREFHRLLRRAGGPRDEAPPYGPPPPGGDPGREPPMPPRPVVLLDAGHRMLLGRLPPDAPLAIEVPVRVEGEIVGYVGTPRFTAPEAALDRQFRAEQLRSLWIVGGLALALAVAVAVWLARNLTRPVERLSHAANRLTRQQYDVDVDVTRRDELGALARDISELARTLSRNADARQRWFADVSHELRTPLTALHGEIEALLDGVRPLTRERIESLQQETLHLQRLVDDLYVLARADLGALQYHKTRLDLGALVRDRVAIADAAFAAAGLSVSCDLPGTGPAVYGDADRLQQLVDNLLANSGRYTDRGGRVHVTLATRHDGAELVVDDSAPGVPPDALGRLFEHLYRVDEARTRARGGAGLGLAICRRIVEAHGGRISATHSPLGGVRITAWLPLDREGAR